MKIIIALLIIPLLIISIETVVTKILPAIDPYAFGISAGADKDEDCQGQDAAADDDTAGRDEGDAAGKTYLVCRRHGIHPGGNQGGRTPVRLALEPGSWQWSGENSREVGDLRRRRSWLKMTPAGKALVTCL